MPARERGQVSTVASPAVQTSSQRVYGMRRVILAALLTAFLVIAQASNEYQCVHVAPGIDCTVQPGWAIWCAYGACFAWLALALMAMIGMLLRPFHYLAVPS